MEKFPAWSSAVEPLVHALADPCGAQWTGISIQELRSRGRLGLGGFKTNPHMVHVQAHAKEEDKANRQQGKKTSSSSLSSQSQDVAAGTTLFSVGNALAGADGRQQLRDVAEATARDLQALAELQTQVLDERHASMDPAELVALTGPELVAAFKPKKKSATGDTSPSPGRSPGRSKERRMTVELKSAKLREARAVKEKADAAIRADRATRGSAAGTIVAGGAIAGGAGGMSTGAGVGSGGTGRDAGRAGRRYSTHASIAKHAEELEQYELHRESQEDEQRRSQERSRTRVELEAHGAYGGYKMGIRDTGMDPTTSPTRRGHERVPNAAATAAAAFSLNIEPPAWGLLGHAGQAAAGQALVDALADEHSGVGKAATGTAASKTKTAMTVGKPLDSLDLGPHCRTLQKKDLLDPRVYSVSETDKLVIKKTEQRRAQAAEATERAKKAAAEIQAAHAGVSGRGGGVPPAAGGAGAHAHAHGHSHGHGLVLPAASAVGAQAGTKGKPGLSPGGAGGTSGGWGHHQSTGKGMGGGWGHGKW